MYGSSIAWSAVAIYATLLAFAAVRFVNAIHARQGRGGCSPTITDQITLSFENSICRRSG